MGTSPIVVVRAESESVPSCAEGSNSVYTVYF